MDLKCSVFLFVYRLYCFYMNLISSFFIAQELIVFGLNLSTLSMSITLDEECLNLKMHLWFLILTILGSNLLFSLRRR